jgi:hypothetical protein
VGFLTRVLLAMRRRPNLGLAMGQSALRTGLKVFSSVAMKFTMTG